MSEDPFAKAIVRGGEFNYESAAIDHPSVVEVTWDYRHYPWHASMVSSSCICPYTGRFEFRKLLVNARWRVRCTMHKLSRLFR